MSQEIAKKWLIFDVDGTVTPKQLFVCVLEQLATKRADIAAILDRAKPILERYERRQGSFQPYIEQLVEEFFDQRRYEGITKHQLHEAVQKAMALYKGKTYVFARELMLVGKELGYLIAIVSGSPADAISAFLPKGMIDAVYATEFVFNQHDTCTDDPVIEYVTDKDRALNEIEDAYGPIDTNSSVYIGDTRSDAKPMRRVKYAICYNPKGELKKIMIAERFSNVVETQDAIYVHRFGPSGERIWQPSLIDVVPPDLAGPLRMRLEEAGWPIV